MTIPLVTVERQGFMYSAGGEFDRSGSHPVCCKKTNHTVKKTRVLLCVEFDFFTFELNKVTAIMSEKRLDEVTLMRMVLAILIVFMHSFVCYNAGWPQPEGYVDISLYKWLSQVSYAFTLPAFVFVSGYLFAYQRSNKPQPWGTVIWRKFKRLIIPSLLFSIIYFVFIYDYKGFGSALYLIVSGCGHMWFLPMLFWCFIGLWLLDIIKIGDGWKLAFLFVLNIFWIKSLPFQLSRTASFLFYFFGGFVVNKYSESIKKHLTIDYVVLSWIVFAVVFVLLHTLKNELIVDPSGTIIQKVCMIARNNLCTVLYAGTGVMAFYLLSVYYTRIIKISDFTVRFASYCFGIYLFQQFILLALYYKTSLPTIIGPYMLPWFGFLITLILSSLLSMLFLKTKCGKFLIG